MSPASYAHSAQGIFAQLSTKQNATDQRNFYLALSHLAVAVGELATSMDEIDSKLDGIWADISPDHL